MEQYAEILSAEKIHEAVTQNRYTHLMQAVVVAVTRCHRRGALRIARTVLTA